MRRGRKRSGALSDRQGSAAVGSSLAGHLPSRLLPRRPDPDQRAERHRSGALGHQGQSAWRAGVRIAGRPDAEARAVYAHAGTAEDIAKGQAQGFTAFKTGPANLRPPHIIESKAFVDDVAEQFAALRAAAGRRSDIAIDFHGAVPPPTSKVLIKALEPYQPMFIEEPVNARTWTCWPTLPAARTCPSPPANA